MNKTDELNLIQTAKELYTNPSFRRIEFIMPNRFLLIYYVREYAKEKIVFAIDFNNLNQITILDYYQVIWSKIIKDKLDNYFKLLGFEVR
jgi:hypothetical protein